MQERNYGAGNGVVLNVDFITTLSTQNVCFYNISKCSYHKPSFEKKEEALTAPLRILDQHSSKWMEIR